MGHVSFLELDLLQLATAKILSTFERAWALDAATFCELLAAWMASNQLGLRRLFHTSINILRSNSPIVALCPRKFPRRKKMKKNPKTSPLTLQKDPGHVPDEHRVEASHFFLKKRMGTALRDSRQSCPADLCSKRSKLAD